MPSSDFALFVFSSGLLDDFYFKNFPVISAMRRLNEPARVSRKRV
jgi:hypothetical protein